MKAIIPAAGIGKRLQPLTLSRPKILIPVAGKPIIGHILDKLIQSGIDEITLIVGYKGKQVVDYVENNYSVRVDFVEQKERKGLGHAVEMGLAERDEPVLIVLGDTILDLNFKHFIQSKLNIIGVMEVDDPRRFGIVEMKNDRVLRLVEKPEHSHSNLAIAGIYLLQNEYLLKKAIRNIIENNITTKGEYQLTDALQILLNWKEEMTVEMIRACYDCGTREALLDTNRHLLSQQIHQPRSFPNTSIIPPVYIHPEAMIKDSVIGPYVSIARGVVIERAILEDTIIDENSLVQKTVLKDSLIGKDARVIGDDHRMDAGDHSRRNLG